MSGISASLPSYTYQLKNCVVNDSTDSAIKVFHSQFLTERKGIDTYLYFIGKPTRASNALNQELNSSESRLNQLAKLHLVKDLLSGYTCKMKQIYTSHRSALASERSTYIELTHDEGCYKLEEQDDCSNISRGYIMQSGAFLPILPK